MKQSVTFISLLLLISLLMSSCSPKFLDVSGVAYQSLRTKTPVPHMTDIPEDASIILSCHVQIDGSIDVFVHNNTDRIMTIDRTKSFFRNQGGNSVPYYDPSVHASSQSSTKSGQIGASVNLGSLAGAVGIGGALGTALGGVTVGGSQGTATTNTNTTYVIDLPQISIAPHGQVSMGRTFKMEGVGFDFLCQAVRNSSVDVNNVFTPTQTYAACNVCVSFSVDEGKSFDTIITDIYANTLLVCKVKQTGAVNDALRRIYINKSDALSEPWFVLYFNSATGSDNKYNDYHDNSAILNYK